MCCIKKIFLGRNIYGKGDIPCTGRVPGTGMRGDGKYLGSSTVPS